MSGDPRVSLELDARGLARVTIRHPERRNAISPPMWDTLADAFETVSQDPDVRVVVLTGQGGAFCSGSDVHEIVDDANVAAGLSRLRRANRMIKAVHRCEKPVFAAVSGSAVGIGFSLALACDLIVAESSARFGGGFLKIGLIPDGGSILLLSTSVGVARAKEIFFSSRLVSAAEGHDLGFVSSVTGDATLDVAIEAAAAPYLTGATTGIALAKRLFRASLPVSLEQYFEAEELAVLAGKATDDAREGRAAFQAKRAPDFRGC